MGTLNVHHIATIAISISDPQSKLDTAYEAFDLLFSGRPLGHHGWNIPVLAGYPISLRSNYPDAMGTHRKFYSTHPEGPLSALSKPKECPEVLFFELIDTANRSPMHQMRVGPCGALALQWLVLSEQ